jgi:hypothetical protein
MSLENPQNNNSTESANAIKAELSLLIPKMKEADPSNHELLESIEKTAASLEQFIEAWQLAEREKINAKFAAENKPIDPNELDEYLGLTIGQIKFILRHMKQSIESMKNGEGDEKFQWGQLIQDMVALEYELIDKNFN